MEWEKLLFHSCSQKIIPISFTKTGRKFRFNFTDFGKEYEPLTDIEREIIKEFGEYKICEMVVFANIGDKNENIRIKNEKCQILKDKV